MGCVNFDLNLRAQSEIDFTETGATTDFKATTNLVVYSGGPDNNAGSYPPNDGACCAAGSSTQPDPREDNAYRLVWSLKFNQTNGVEVTIYNKKSTFYFR